MPHITHRFRGARFSYLGNPYELLPLGAHGGSELVWLRRCDAPDSYGVMSWDGAELLTAGAEDAVPVTGLAPRLRELVVEALSAANPPPPMMNDEFDAAHEAVQRDAAFQLRAAYTPREEGTVVLAVDVTAMRLGPLGFAREEVVLKAGSWVRGLKYQEGMPAQAMVEAVPACWEFRAYDDTSRRWCTYHTDTQPETYA